MFPSVFASAAGAVSRFGPIVPLEPAGLNVWHDEQPDEPKSVLPAATLPVDELVVVIACVVVGVDVGVDVEVGVEPTVVVTVAGGLPSDV